MSSAVSRVKLMTFLRRGSLDVTDVEVDGKWLIKVNFLPCDTWDGLRKTLLFSRAGELMDERMDDDVADELLRALAERFLNDADKALQRLGNA